MDISLSEIKGIGPARLKAFEAAGISRQTFYTLFTSRENVMVLTLQSRACCETGAERAGGAGQEGLRRLCRGYSEYLLQNRELIKLLVENNLEHLLYDSFYASMDGCACFLPRSEPGLRSCAASFYAGGITFLARRYAREGCIGTAGELEGLLMTLLSGALF